ncbi:hypothetical protein KSX_31440 [Ktedonospora formicarum]|uniref:Uncharacterized protein n=1 Tax=Ktedonospora formicarum TaxID=2778364 RepID=A0A8J3MSK9_9CHLR|nr:hypothetical protein KSX_31440 [Ktedonospora formicarum]
MAAKNAPPQSQNKPTNPGITRQALPQKPKASQGGTSQWLDTLSDIKIGQPDQPAHPKPQVSPGPKETPGPRQAPGYNTPPAPQSGHSTYPSTREQGLGERRFNERSNYGDRGGYSQRGPSSYRERESGYNSGGYKQGGYGQRGPSNYREGGYQGGGYREGGQQGGYQGGGYNRGPGGYHPGSGQGQPGPYGQRPRPHVDGTYGQRPRPERTGGRPGPARPPRERTKPTRPITPPKLKRDKTPPPEPFIPTQEQITKVEGLYLELAAPAEFDGIRTQIAKEVQIPKKAVKKIVKDLRDRQHMPSWWEAQTYKGSVEELERIKEVYLPMLPIPPVGVHKIIATQLTLKPGVVYQAIKSIRLEMNLPQYNDPSLHGDFDASPKETQASSSLSDRPSSPQTGTEIATEEHISAETMSTHPSSGTEARTNE